MSVRIDLSGVLGKIDAMKKMAIRAATNQALIDTNPYVPFDTGALMGTSMSNSIIEEGHIEWVTPYARVLWTGTRKGRALKINKIHHAKATKKWTEAAKRDNLEHWRRAAEKAMGGHT